MIATLTSLLLAGLSKAKNKAHAVTCKNNLRQISLGAHLYLADYHVHVPYFNTRAPGAVAGATHKSIWSETLVPHVGSELPPCNSPDYELTSALAKIKPGATSGTYVCPGYNLLNGVYAGGPGTPEVRWFDAGAYAYNWVGGGFITGNFRGESLLMGLGGGLDDATLTPFALTHESQVVVPSKMIAFGYSAIGFPLDPHIRASRLEYGLLKRELNGYNLELAEKERRLAQYSKRHDAAKFHIAFADGHVESLAPRTLFNLRDPAVVSRWNKDHLPHPEFVKGLPVE